MPRWPHAPLHRLGTSGTYIVTAGTYQKAHVLATRRHLALVQDHLLDLPEATGWHLQAWALFSNHYHVVVSADHQVQPLAAVLANFHRRTATELNCLDNAPARRVWFQYWDTELTFQRSYLARLKYVMYNPVHHSLVHEAREYEWCSANWFAQTVGTAFQRTVSSFGLARITVQDDFAVVPATDVAGNSDG